MKTTKCFRLGSLGALFLSGLLVVSCGTDAGGTSGAGDISGGGDSGTAVVVDPDLGETFTASISAAEGGTLATASGSVTLVIPGGALDADTELSVSVGAATGDTASAVYSLGPDHLIFAKPVSLSIAYSGDPGAGNKPVIAWKDGDSWSELPGSVFADGEVSAAVNHFSDFAIIITSTGVTQQGSCGELPSSFTPCGGDLVGTWTIDTVCIYWDPDDTPGTGSGTAFEHCPDLVFAISADWDGTYTFDATTFTANIARLVGTRRWEIPLSCLSDDAACASVEEGMEDGTCVDDGSVCTCESETLGGEDLEIVLSYETSGSTITSTDDDGVQSSSEYCVDGGRVTFHSVGSADDPLRPGAPEWLVMTRL